MMCRVLGVSQSGYYADGRELFNGLLSYFASYNDERYHESLDYRTPAQVHYGLT